MARSSKLSVLTCSAAVLLAGLVYLNALNNPFVYDDYRSILNNRSLTSRASITSVVLENVSRPLVSLSYVIDHAVWGPAPFGYHVTSVLLHMLNVALLFLFTRGLALQAAFRHPPQPAALNALPGINRVEALGSNHFLLGRDPDHDPTEELVERSVREGWGLYELGPVHSRLEDVFVQLTRDESAA